MNSNVKSLIFWGVVFVTGVTIYFLSVWMR
jgi:hypothetical protein